MINIHFFNEIIYFLARIDQQAEIYHSSLSKQDIIKQQKNKQKTKQNKQTNKQTNKQHKLNKTNKTIRVY